MSNTVPQHENDRSDHIDTHSSPDEVEQVNKVLDIIQDDAGEPRGLKIERIITTKDFVPPGDPQFTARLGMEPRGTRVILGSLRGVVKSTQRKTNLWQGKELESVYLNGEFEAVMVGTGEIKAAPTAILPKAFGMTIETALASLDEGERAELAIDCDIGLEATGRNIPYEWIVIYYRDGKAQKAMREARTRSDRRLAKQSQKALPAS